MEPSTQNPVYARPPLSTPKGIPDYISGTTAYLDNYAKISADHLENLRIHGVNPWIDEDFWQEMELSTETLAKKYSNPSDKVLDVGVGLGRLLDRFEGWDRYGVDISLAYLAESQKKGIEVCRCMVEDLPYQDGFFDLIVSTDVLEHVLDLSAAIRRILAVLKPGGTLVVRVPYREDLASYLAPDFPYEFVHLRNFDESTLTLLFTRIFGCELLGLTYTGMVPTTARFINARLARYPRIYQVLWMILSRLKNKKSPAYQFLFHQFFWPNEINVAVRKPTA